MNDFFEYLFPPKTPKIDIEQDDDLNVKGILGPQYCRFYKNLDGKNIFILGETHGLLSRFAIGDEDIYKENYVYATDWFYNIITSSDKCIDIFLETPVKYMEDRKTKLAIKKEKPFTSILQRLRQLEYQTCKGSKCINPNIRFHQTDIRFLKGYGYDAGDIVSHFGANYKYLLNYYLDKNVEFDSKLLDLEKNLINYSPSSKNKIKDILPSKKIFEDKKALIQKQIKKLDPSISEKFISSLKKACLKNEEISGDMYTDAMALDIYQIIRMFVKWDDKKMSRMSPKSKCKGANSPKNIIVYGGTYHTAVLDDFLNIYFGKAKTKKALKFKYGDDYSISRKNYPLPFVEFKKYFNILEEFE